MLHMIFYAICIIIREKVIKKTILKVEFWGWVIILCHYEGWIMFFKELCFHFLRPIPPCTSSPLQGRIQDFQGGGGDTTSSTRFLGGSGGTNASPRNFWKCESRPPRPPWIRYCTFKHTLETYLKK